MKQPRYHQAPVNHIDPNEEFKQENKDISADIFMTVIVIVMLAWLGYKFVESI